MVLPESWPRHLVHLISSFALAVLLAACATGDVEPSSTEDTRTCDVGVYGMGASKIALTDFGERYGLTSLNGVRNYLSDSELNSACVDGSLVLPESSELAGRWSKVDILGTDTNFQSGEVTLAGRLLQPADAQAAPLVVFAHGSESFGWIGAARDPYLLAAQGINVFVYDKRGTGLSGGTFSKNFEVLAEDLRAAVAHASSLADGSYGSIGLVGLSQGGWIAPLAAKEIDVNFLVVGYGLVLSTQEEDAEEVFAELRRRGFSEPVIQQAKEITVVTARIMASKFRDGLDELNELKARYKDEPWFEHIDGEYTGELLRLSPEEALKEVYPRYADTNWTFDPLESLRAVDVPQTWVLAGNDREAPADLTVERLHELRSAGKDISIYVVEGVDHGMLQFSEASDGTREYGDYAPAYYRLIADIIKDETAEEYSGVTLVAP